MREKKQNGGGINISGISLTSLVCIYLCVLVCTADPRTQVHLHVGFFPPTVNTTAPHSLLLAEGAYRQLILRFSAAPTVGAPNACLCCSKKGKSDSEKVRGPRRMSAFCHLLLDKAMQDTRRKRKKKNTSRFLKLRSTLHSIISQVCWRRVPNGRPGKENVTTGMTWDDFTLIVNQGL